MLKMKDDPDFNIHFVGVIEEHPCIYDHSISDYSNRNVINNTWEKIAKRVSDPGKYYFECVDRSFYSATSDGPPITIMRFIS